MVKGDSGEINVTAGEDEPEAMRIFIGGVSSGVTDGDIEKTFSSMGKVTGVELVHSNGRSFAYMDFQPNSQKSLAKLFSTYNGCTWKGGKLKLEKAKEHYFARLKREWEEDAAKVMPATPVNPKIEKDAPKLKSECLNLEDTHLQIFFPKLRKVKSLPLKGTGKHKYSFQRVEVPPLPIHFCDCEEHLQTSEAASQNYLSSLKSGVFIEKELNVMNSVMNKLFEKQNNEMTSDRETELTTHANTSESLDDDISFEETDITLDMDDADNIVTNIGTTRRDGKLKQSTGEKLSTNQKSIFGKKQSSRDVSTRNKEASQKRQKTSPADASEVKANCKITEDEFSAILPRSIGSEVQSRELEAFAESPSGKSQTELSMSNTQSTKGHSWVQKSSWRDLVGEVRNSPFSISHVLPDIIPVSSRLPKLDNPGIVISTTATKKTTKAQSEKGKLRPSLVTEDISPDHTEMTQVENQIQANQVSDEQKEPQNTSNKQPRRVIPKVGVSEVCTFMRSEESEKEWLKARSTLSGYLKKKMKKKKKKKSEENDASKSFRHMPPRRS